MTPAELITAFRAALDTEEQYARQAFADETGETLPDWHELSSGVLEIGADTVLTGDARVSRFMERHDPAFVLADIAAKRRFLDEYERYVAERRRAMLGWDTSEVSPVLIAFAEAYGIRA